MTLTPRQLTLLAALTLIWGLNWPVMKMGVSGYPAFAFRAMCMWLGLPVLAAGMLWLKTPFRVPRAHWRELLWLALTNAIVWQVMIMVALVHLSSGRAAILGYSMPIFSALLSLLFYGERLGRRQWLGVAAAGTGVVLLLWHEVTALSGKPWGVLCALLAAATWAVGIRQMRHTRIPTPTLTLSFWMIALTALVLTLLTLLFERAQWAPPTGMVAAAVAYNALLVFGFATTVHLYLSRTLPPLAASLSVMLIPILGVFSGAHFLDEVLHWQDWAAMALMVVAIASVLLPSRHRPIAQG